MLLPVRLRAGARRQHRADREHRRVRRNHLHAATRRSRRDCGIQRTRDIRLDGARVKPSQRAAECEVVRAVAGDDQVQRHSGEALEERGILRGDALRIGATDFLEQPVDLPELVARVVNLLSLRHAQAELKSLRAGPANLAPEYRDTAKAMLH